MRLHYKSILLTSWVGGSSQSKLFQSWPGDVSNHVRAAIVDRPLEHIQVPSQSCSVTSPIIPRAALAPEPLQYLQVTALGCPPACIVIKRRKRAALAPEPLQYLHMASNAG